MQEYAERLFVPISWWLVGFALAASAWWAYTVALPDWLMVILTLLTLALTSAALVWFGSARVRVGAGEFKAGRAHLPLRYVGEVTSLDAEATHRLATVEANALAYLVLRPWLKRAVRVDLTDPQDPCPYWLVSSRRPDELAAALRSAKQHLTD